MTPYPAQISLIAAVMTLVTQLPVAVPAVDIQAEMKIREERCYEFNDRRECFFLAVEWRSSFTFAQQFCASNDATIVSIRSNEMQQVVERYITDARLGWYVRTGAKYQRDGNTWFWLSRDHQCDEDKISNQSTPADYRTHAASWLNSISHPSSVDLIARKPTDQLPYVCQFPARSKSCSTKEDSFTVGSWCYVAHSTARVTWYQARNRCLAVGGDLLVLYDDVTRGLPGNKLKSSLPFWILLRNGYWTWPDGREVLYTNWMDNQPTNAALTCMVLDYHDPWKWTTYDCAEQLDFICVRNVHPVCEGCLSVGVGLIVLAVAAACLCRRNGCRRWRNEMIHCVRNSRKIANDLCRKIVNKIHQQTVFGGKLNSQVKCDNKDLNRI